MIGDSDDELPPRSTFITLTFTCKARKKLPFSGTPVRGYAANGQKTKMTSPASAHKSVGVSTDK
jgi:hypothetical protein